MSQKNNDRIDQLIELMLPRIMPLIVANLNHEKSFQKHIHRKNLVKTYPEGLYIPELDYLLYAHKILGEIREARYHLGRNIRTVREADNSDFPYGILVLQGMECSDFILPSATLRRDIAVPYDIDFKVSYNSQGSASRYIPGILNGSMNPATEEKIKSSAASYAFCIHTPISQAVIDNTRDEWEQMTPERKARRIISEETMFALLKAFEEQRAQPFHIAWEVEVAETGRTLEQLAHGAGVAFDWTLPNGGLAYDNQTLLMALRKPLRVNANHQLGLTPVSAWEENEDDDEYE